MKTLIIFDLEATCWEEGYKLGRNDSEIIEIGAIKVNRETGDIIDTYQRFVRPHFHPVLSDYCKNLTSIKQEEIYNADLLEDVLPEFNSWMGDYVDYIMSWGHYDRNQIISECKLKNIEMGTLRSKLNNKHLNMKNQFSHVFNIRRCGFSKALKFLNLKFEGTQHRGIDDAKNMAIVYKKVKNEFFNKIYDND